MEPDFASLRELIRSARETVLSASISALAEDRILGALAAVASGADSAERLARARLESAAFEISLLEQRLAEARGALAIAASEAVVSRAVAADAGAAARSSAADADDRVARLASVKTAELDTWKEQ
jgi:trimeric autotransporter adhesin